MDQVEALEDAAKMEFYDIDRDSSDMWDSAYFMESMVSFV